MQTLRTGADIWYPCGNIYVFDIATFVEPCPKSVRFSQRNTAAFVVFRVSVSLRVGLPFRFVVGVRLVFRSTAGALFGCVSTLKKTSHFMSIMLFMK